MPESVFIQLHLSKAYWEIRLSEDQPHSDYNGQWRRTLCIVVFLQSPHLNPQRNKKIKLYAIKQIKICAEYWDMLPRPRLNLSGAPGLRPLGLNPVPWQTSFGLGSMSRYSAQILFYITKWGTWTSYGVTNRSPLAQNGGCRLIATKPWSGLILIYFQLVESDFSRI